MSRVMIDDRWLKDGAPSRVKRSLAQARDPFKARGVPDGWRTSVYGHGLRWRCRWYQGGVGSKRQRSKSFGDLASAQAFTAAMEDDIRRGRYHDPTQESRVFSDVAEQWLESKVDLRASTADRYRRELVAYVYPTWGDTQLRQITSGGVQKWVSALAEGKFESNISGGRRKARALSPASIRSVVKIVMGGVMGFAVDQGWIVENPVSSVRLPKTEYVRPLGILTIAEVEEVASAAVSVSGDPMMGTLVRFQAYTGARIGETTALVCGDVDLRALRARIHHTWSDTPEGRQLAPPKNGKPRTIALPASLRRELAELMLGRRALDFLFRNSEGGALNARNIYNRVWKPALRACRLDGQGITIHSLRHTYASLAIANGADVKTLQTQLGHSSATITLDTYASLWPDRLDQVEKAVDAARVRAIADTGLKAGLSPARHDSDTIAAQKWPETWTTD